MASDSRIIVSARGRFVNRAVTLQEDAEFLRDVADAKRRWNARDRAFAIEHETPPPDDLSHASDNHLYPPRLVSAQYGKDSGDDKTPMREFNKSVHQAKAEWRSLVQSLCEAYWRDLNPTNWMGPNAHPAQHFVAACLIYKPKFVDVSCICNDVPMLVALPSPSQNISDVTRQHETIHAQVRDEVFHRLCRDHLATNQSMVLEEYEQFLRQATEAAEEAVAGNSIEDRYSLSKPIMALPLTPGMSKKDARALADAGVEEAMTDTYYKNLALTLYAENVSITEISKRLGFDRKWVQITVRAKLA